MPSHSHMLFSSARKITSGDAMEDINDIFKKLNQRIASDQKEGSGLTPRVVSQKEDVIYIKNPA